MSLKKILLTASALALLTGGVFADGGPVPEEPPAPPPEPYAPPPEEEPAPPPAPEPAAPSVWYVSVHGGAVWADDIILLDAGLPFWFNVAADLDMGWGAGGTVGRRYGSWRGELEATWRQNDGNAFDSLTFDVYDTEVDSLSIMVNVVHDIDLGSFLVPYLGAGIGASHVTVDGILFSEEDSWAFAYQFLGGISIAVPNSSAEFFVDYRYLTTSGLDLDFNGAFRENDDYQAQSVMGGVRFNF